MNKAKPYHNTGLLIFPTSNRLQALDHLRALAVICVLVSHFGIAINSNLIEIQNKTINIGTIGVFIFFCVSGYVIPWSMQTKSKDGFISAREFWIRRTFRLLPIYLITGLLGFMFFGDLAVSLKVEQEFKNSPISYLLEFFTMTGYWKNQTSIFQGLEWTLAYEVVFYLACTVFLLFKRIIRGLLPLKILIIIICTLTLIPDFLHINNNLQKFFFMYLFFLIGLLVFLYQNKTISRVTFFSLSLIVILTITTRNIWWYSHSGINYMTFAFIPALTIYYLIVFKKLIIYSKALTITGVVSYSIYLTHIFIPHNIPLLNYPSALRFTIWAVLAVGIAVPLYRLIELPSINLSRKLLHR